jgi:hypothetical protein
MRLIKYFTYILFLFWFGNSCIEPFDPVIGNDNISKIVVTGQVTSMEGIQTVFVSLSSSLKDPKFIPLSNCMVNILDDKGNTFSLTESKKGQYEVWMAQRFLNTGTSYQVHIITPSDDEIISDFETMLECPEVDSVYFLRKDLQTTNPEVNVLGIQFYLDFDGRTTSSHFFRWELEETYEYHAPYPMQYYYDGVVHEVSPPDKSKGICWAINKIPNIYTLSTTNLEKNKYEMLPLHYIDNHSNKFLYGYSLLIKQFALSEQAYTYWDQLRININKQGGLYDKQPLPITGNLNNKTHPEKEVLGFFNVSGMKMKRIFIKKVDILPFNIIPLCMPQFQPLGFFGMTAEEFPAYFIYDAEGKIYTLELYCINCLYEGGTLNRPNYWPKP